MTVDVTNPLATVDKPENEDPGGSFNPDDYAWYDHLKVALADLTAKKLEIDIDWRYYDGDHPRIWMTEALKEMFEGELEENMSENWCDLAVEAPIKRLSVTGWTNPTDNSINTSAAKNVFDENDMELEQKELYRQARAVGESFAFVWLDDEKEFGIDINIQDARNVWWPKNAKRNDPERVVLVWMDEDEGIWRATCYYRYVVVRLAGPKINQAKTIPEARYFVVDPDDPGGIHGFERVPVIRFAPQKRRRGIISQIRHQQDKINKLAANKLVAAEFGAFGKTIILTQQEIDDDTLKFRPNRATVLDPGGPSDSGAPTSIWEGTATELANYDNSISVEIDKLFTMAQLPGHMQVKSTREVPSGAAYDADEGPFTEMIADLQESFGASWTDLFGLAGIEAKPQWRNPHVRSDIDEATTVKTFVDAKMPLTLALKYYAGWDEDQLKELEEAPLSAQETQELAMANALNGMGSGQDAGTQSGNKDANNSGSSGSGFNPSRIP